MTLTDPSLRPTLTGPTITAETLDLVRSQIATGRCNLLLASITISAEAAGVGYLLSDLVSGGDPSRQKRMISFFTTSDWEALAGAIKLARHTSVRRRNADGGAVVFHDPDCRYRDLFDPLGRGAGSALCPGIEFVDTIEAARQLLESGQWCAMVVCPSADESHASRHLLHSARNRGVLSIVVRSQLDVDDPALFADPGGADVIVFGDNLTEGQLPFGAFTMTPRAYSTWNNPIDSVAHTCTFGGNALVLTAVSQALRRHRLIDSRHEDTLSRIDSDMGQRCEYFARHVNPTVTALEEMFGMALDVKTARGAVLQLADGRKVLDCTGGSGSNLRGHNPPDVAERVTERHDRDRDYLGELQGRLEDLTGYPRLFPAVSGASAVDTAVLLALAANPAKPRIVTFTGNYSGKSLISLNLSKFGPQLTDSDRDAFRPYYRQLTYIDPFSPTAVDDLTDTLGRGDVGLVWFEPVQGFMCRRIPDRVVEAVAELKEQHGYLVGVDEILTGIYRLSPALLEHRRLLGHADVVTIGKPLSDMLIPTGFVLASEDVYRRAESVNPGLVRRLKTRFANPLSAHVALNALDSLHDGDRLAQIRDGQQILETGLRNLAPRSKVIGEVIGEGSLLRLTLNPRRFPFSRRSRIGQLLETALSGLLLDRADVFVPALRFLHRIVADPDEMNQIVSRLDETLASITPGTVYRRAVTALLSSGPRGLWWLTKGYASTLERPALQISTIGYPRRPRPPGRGSLPG